MRTRTFCPGCGGYRDIEEGHDMCTFCEYLDAQQNDAKKTLSNEPAPSTFTIDGVAFTVRFGVELASIVATVDASDPAYDMLACCLTAAWKLEPVKLLESLCDHRVVQVGEFYTITYATQGDGNVLDVNILDGEEEIAVPAVFFTAVVIKVAKAHLQRVGEAQFSWLTTLSSAAKTNVL